MTYGSEFTRLRYYFAECNRVARLDVTPEGPERTCDRCSVFYTALEATEVCVHHWGKKKYDDSKPAGQPIKAEKKQQQNGKNSFKLQKYVLNIISVQLIGLF